MGEVFRIWACVVSKELANCTRDVCAAYFTLFDVKFPPTREDIELISNATGYRAKFVVALPTSECFVVKRQVSEFVADSNAMYEKSAKLECRRGTNGLIEVNVTPQVNYDFYRRFSCICAAHILRCRKELSVPTSSQKLERYTIYVLRKSEGPDRMDEVYKRRSDNRILKVSGNIEENDPEAEMLLEFHRFADSRKIPLYPGLDTMYIDRYSEEPQLPMRRKAFLYMLTMLNINGILCVDDEFMKDPLTFEVLTRLSIRIIKM